MLTTMQEFEKSIQSFVHLAQTAKSPALILIDGPAGAGKSTLGEKIAQAHDLNLLHMDDFYSGWDEPLDAALYSRVQQALEHLRNPLQVPNFQVFNWTLREFQPKTQTAVSAITVIEGVGAFGCAAGNEIQKLKIWTIAETSVCFQRVLDRDGPDYFDLIKKWQSHEAKYFESTAAAAQAELTWQT